MFSRHWDSGGGKGGTSTHTRHKRRRSRSESHGNSNADDVERRTVKFNLPDGDQRLKTVGKYRRQQLPSPEREGLEDAGKLPWRKHKGIDLWVEENTTVRSKGERPGGALVIVGPRFSGKTAWAKGFGKHIHLLSLHCPTAMQVDHDGYVVCDNMTKDYPYAKQLLSCQSTVTVCGDDGKMVQLAWGRPCIWTCDKWDDPRKWSEEMAGFLSEACTVFDMYESGWSNMFESDVDGLNMDESRVEPDAAESGEGSEESEKRERSERVIGVGQGRKKEKSNGRRRNEKEEGLSFL